jgi:hypothetical protein
MTVNAGLRLGSAAGLTVAVGVGAPQAPKATPRATATTVTVRNAMPSWRWTIGPPDCSPPKDRCVEVGRMQARAILGVAPHGNYLFIKGDHADANADLVRSGQDEVLKAAIASGAMTNVGESYTADWSADLAQTATEKAHLGQRREDRGRAVRE